MNDNNLTNITKQSFFKSYLTNFNLKIYKYSLFKMLKSVGGGIYILLLTFIAFIIPGSFLIFKVSDLSNISKLWMKVNKYLLIVGITFIFTSLKVMQIFRNDIKDGTLLILLSKPISRTRIYLQKFFAIFTMIIIVSIFYLLFTNLPLYLIIKNIDPSQPFTRWRDAIDDYTSINLPLINNLISDVKANIVYGFLNLIIVLIVSSLFIMLTMVFQNIKLTIFAPLIGMGVVIFNTESVIMKLMLKDDDYRSNSIKYMDINYGSPLLLLNDLKSSTNKDKKLIWEDIKEIFRQKIEVKRKYKDLFDNNNNRKDKNFDIKKDKPNDEERLTILEDVIFKNLKVWKLDFKNLKLNRELNELLTTRLKKILPIKQKIDLLDSAIKGIKDEKEKLRIKVDKIVSDHWDELNGNMSNEKRKEIQNKIDNLNSQIISLDREIAQKEREKSELVNEKANLTNLNYKENQENWSRKINKNIYANLKNTIVLTKDINYAEVLNLKSNENHLINIDGFLAYLNEDYYYDRNRNKIDVFFKNILESDSVENLEFNMKKLLKIELSNLIWKKIFNYEYAVSRHPYNKSRNFDLLDIVLSLPKVQIDKYSVEDYKTKVKTKKWISWLSPLEHLSYILEGYNSKPNIYEYLINPNFNEKDGAKYIDDEMFKNGESSIFKEVDPQYNEDRSYYEINSDALFNKEQSKIKVKYFLNWYIVISIYIILSIAFFSLALLKFNKTDFS